MKSNLFKYLFFISVIILIIIAIYLIYKDENNKTLAIDENIAKPNIKNEINIGIVGYDTINPILSNNRDVQYITKLIFEPLLDISKNFEIKNTLAKEFSKINNKTYIIKLKDDIYWHNKTKFTSKDVIFTINNIKEANSIYKENIKSIEKIEQIDEYTIKLFLNEEIPFFEYNMCFPIIPYNFYENKEINGTGKFKVKEINDNLIKLEIVNTEEDINIKNINVILKNSNKELYNAFLKEEIDYLVTENIEYESYLGTMGYNINKIPGREYEYLVLNNNNSILSNKEVRKAINLAIDKNNINYNIFNNKYINSSFPIVNDENSNKTNEAGFNINQAKSTLVENGWTLKNNIWTKNNKNLKFNLVVNNENNKRVLLAEEISKQLNNLGIKINIIKLNRNSYNYYLKNKNYDMIITGNIISNSPNLETYFGENNLSNYKNEKVKEILNDIKNIDNKDMLKEKYIELYKIYAEEVPFISLYFNSMFIISNKNLKGDLTCNWYNLFYNIDGWYKINKK